MTDLGSYHSLCFSAPNMTNTSIDSKLPAGIIEVWVDEKNLEEPGDVLAYKSVFWTARSLCAGGCDFFTHDRCPMCTRWGLMVDVRPTAWMKLLIGNLIFTS